MFRRQVALPPADDPASAERLSGVAEGSAPGAAETGAPGVAEALADGVRPDLEHRPLRHTPASLREWTGASHAQPRLRSITPNLLGLPVEAAVSLPRRGESPAPGRPAALPPTNRPPTRRTETAVVPSARTGLRGMEPFEVDPVLLGAASASPPAPTPLVPAKPAEPPPPASPGLQQAGAAPPPASAAVPAAMPPVVPSIAATAVPAAKATALSGAATPPPLTALGDPSLEVEADRVDGTVDPIITATGQAYVRKGWDELFGDVVRWNIASSEASGEGNIVKRDRDSEATGSRFQYNAQTRKGELQDASFSVSSFGGRGTAGRLRFDGPGRYIGDDEVRYTTCDFNDPDWLMKADSVEIDQNLNEGNARNVRILANGKYPVFYLPRYQWALNKSRKSGFLTPLVGITNRTGPQVFLPYYWNIAPNYDATITTRLMTTRGIQVGGEFRYLDEAFSGEARAEYVPDDRQFGGHRWALAFDHRQLFSERLSGVVDYQQVSDDLYFRDLRNNIGASGASASASAANVTDPGAIPGVRGGTATRLLAQSAALEYAGDNWSLTSQLRSFQVLQPDSVNRVVQPYQALPNIRFNATQSLAGLAEGRLTADFAAYSLRYPEPGETRREGNRTVINPSISLPIRSVWGYVEPKLSYHATHYALDPLSTNSSDSFTRSVPTATIDSGLTFERKASDDGAIQTLEPRLMYAYTPFRNQVGLPVFDTGRFDFNFAEIFSANRFVGNDRIGDANQITGGLTTRYIDNKGVERFNLTLAQRYHLTDLRVVDDVRSIVDRSDKPPAPLAAPQKGVSDVLGEFSGRLFKDTRLISRVQYNTDTTQVQRGLVSLRYNPEMGKVINVGYRYTREISDAQLGLQQVDFSTQWPITSNLYALARTNYSLLESRPTESLFGLEYYGSCWSVRTVIQSLATSATTTTRALFIVLELNGLTGTDPSTYNAILNRHIGGYSTITPDQNRTTDAMIQ